MTAAEKELEAFSELIQKILRLWPQQKNRAMLIQENKELYFDEFKNRLLHQIAYYSVYGGLIKPGSRILLQTSFSSQWLIDFFFLIHCRAVIVLPEVLNHLNTDSLTSSANSSKADGFSWQKVCSTWHKSIFFEKILLEGQVKKVPLAFQAKKSPGKLLSVQARRLLKQVQKNNEHGVVFFTSGSSGQAKAALQSLEHMTIAYLNQTTEASSAKAHQQKDEQIRSKAQRLPAYNTFLVFKENHVGGINTLLRTLARGATLYHVSQEKDWYAFWQKWPIEFLACSPSFLRILRQLDSDPAQEKSSLNKSQSHLKLVSYGSEPMPPELLQYWQKRWPEVRWQQTYGLTETGVFRIRNKLSDDTFFCIEDPGVKFKLRGSELYLKSAYQIYGYLNAAWLVDQEGYFASGDFIQWDQEEKFFKIIGRKNDWINVGGEKIYLNRIEEILEQHDWVESSLVQAEKNPLLGQIPVAHVKLKTQNLKLLTEVEKTEFKQTELPGYKDQRMQMLEQRYREELEDYCLNHLPRFAVPLKWFFWQESAWVGQRLKKNRQWRAA